MDSLKRRLRLIAPLLLATLLGCQRSTTGAPQESFSSTATVTRGTLADVVQVYGQVVAPTSKMVSVGSRGGRVVEVLVQLGQVVQEGQPLVRLETADLERELREAEADLAVAEAMLAEAQRTAGEADVAKAEADLAAAEAELAAAELELRLVEQAGLAPLQQAVADDEYALRVAQDQLRLAELDGSEATISQLEYNVAFYQRYLRDLKPGEDPSYARNELAKAERELATTRAAREERLRQARDAVTSAQEKLAKSQAALARARAGQEDPTAKARLACEQARSKVEQAKRTVEDLKAGADSAAVKAARTTYEAAVARVEGARAAIAEATLTAPFTATVYGLLVQVNDEVQPGAAAVYLADLTDLRVQAMATEMDIARLSVGQEVRLNFDAYPGKLLSGRVLLLPAKGQADAGMAYYQIETSVEPGDLDLLPGMTASVRVLVGQKEDALLVPVAAVRYRSPEETFVTVQTPDGKTRQQKVRIGLNDGILAEVLEGLSEGQTVLIPLVPPTEPRRMGPYMGPMY